MSPVQVIAVQALSFFAGVLACREVLLYRTHRTLQRALREDREVAELETIFDREWE